MDGEGQSHDARQFARMLSVIDVYERGAIGLSGLIVDLEALNAALLNPPGNWRERFRSQWGTLEEVHASMADRGTTRLDDPDRSLNERALTNLKYAIHESLGEPG